MAIVEFRTYTLRPGTVGQWEGNFGAALPGRVKHSELAALWHTEIGPLNQVIHAWPYGDLAHRTEVRALAACRREICSRQVHPCYTRAYEQNLQNRRLRSNPGCDDTVG